MDAIQERGIRLQLTAAQPKKSRLDGNDSENDDDEEGAGKQVGLPPFYRHITGGDFRVHLDMETNQALLWPVLFLYPEYKETDLIADFHEDQCIGDHIEAMFGPEVPSAVWDLENKYCSSDLVVYFLSSNGDVGARAATENPPKLYKVGREMTLREVLAHPDFVVFDGLPTFSVVVKGSPFNKKFKKMFLEVPTTSIIQ